MREITTKFDVELKHARALRDQIILDARDRTSRLERRIRSLMAMRTRAMKAPALYAISHGEYVVVDNPASPLGYAVVHRDNAALMEAKPVSVPTPSVADDNEGWDDDILELLESVKCE